MKMIGKPYVGELQVRFDEGEQAFIPWQILNGHENWKQWIQPRICLTNDPPALYSTHITTHGQLLQCQRYLPRGAPALKIMNFRFGFVSSQIRLARIVSLAAPAKGNVGQMRSRHIKEATWRCTRVAIAGKGGGRKTETR
jgi:hypothetical protein